VIRFLVVMFVVVGVVVVVWVSRKQNDCFVNFREQTSISNHL
jgi:hypothetical protein